MLRRAFLLALAFFAAPAALAFDPKPSGIFAAQGTVEVAFSPWDDAEGAILRAIRGARRSIHVQAYLFTSRALASALIEARVRGVAVEILADRDQAMKGENSQLRALIASGIPVWLEVNYAAAHNKILVVDAGEPEGAVVTGSYNFTYSAQARNAENVVILRGNPPLLKSYHENWQRHRRDALPYAQGMIRTD